MPENPNNNIKVMSELKEILGAEQNQLEHSEYLMDELISRPPNWLLNSGMTILTYAVFIGLVLSFIIKYPDRIAAPFTLTHDLPPIEVVAGMSGQVSEINVLDQDSIIAGQLLLRMKSVADWNDIRRLESWFASLAGNYTIHDVTGLQLPTALELGSLQPHFTTCIEHIALLQYLVKQNLIRNKVESISREIEEISLLNTSLEKQKQIFREEVKLFEKNLNRNKILNKSNDLSDSELELESARYLQKQRQYENMDAGIIQNLIRIRQLRRDSIELIAVRRERIKAQFSEVKQSITELQNVVSIWKERHLVFAPTEGHIDLFPGLDEGKFLSEGEPMAYIIPLKNHGRNKALCTVPLFGAGKIIHGSKVQLELETYPAREYGVIEGEISKIALLPEKDESGQTFQRMEILLPDTLLTNYYKQIPFQIGTTGVATIITNDKRVLERIFEDVFTLLLQS